MRESEWQHFETLPDQASAEVRVGLLEQGGVPAKVITEGPLPGLEVGVHVFVPADLLHRAKWLSAQSRVSDAELEFLATGELNEVNRGQS